MVFSNLISLPRLAALFLFIGSANTESTVTVVLFLPTFEASTRQSSSKLFSYNGPIVHHTTGAPALLTTPFPLFLLPNKFSDDNWIEFEDYEDDEGCVGGSSHALGPGR